MLPFALKAVWFTLCLLGTISAWVTLVGFARAVGSYWGPMFYCVALTLLQGVICIGKTSAPKYNELTLSEIHNRDGMADGSFPDAAKLLSHPNSRNQLQCLSINWDMCLLKHNYHNLNSSAIRKSFVRTLICPSIL